MSTIRLGALCLVLAILMLSAVSTCDAAELVRGLVVDRSNSVLWLGLPAPVQRGAVFNVYLVPGNQPIARATVIDITPDAPYVAKAQVQLLTQDAFVPVGAYVEITGEVLPATDRQDGFKDVEFGEETARRLSFRAGAFFPTSSDLADETTDVWPTFQLAYRLGSMRGANSEIGIAYYHQDGDFSVGGLAGTRDFRVLPLTYDARFPMSRTGQCGWFARAGVGAYYIRDRRTLGADTTSENTVTFGWQAGFGYVSRGGRSAEIYYTDVSKTDFRGVVFSLGARF